MWKNSKQINIEYNNEITQCVFMQVELCLEISVLSKAHGLHFCDISTTLT